jgi:putative ABC transport system permease protein
MKYLGLIFSSMLRKPARAFLMFLSLAIAFVLFGVLHGIDVALSQLVSQQRLGRLFVEARFGRPLPVAHRSQIESLRGVVTVTEVGFFGAYHREPQNSLLVIATSPERWLRIRPEYEVSREQLRRLLDTRSGALITQTLAVKQGWRVGDRLTLSSQIPKSDGSTTWSFEIVGIMSTPGFKGDNPVLLANFSYFDELRQMDRGTAFRFLIRVSDPLRAAQIAQQVDALFVNSPAPTRTQPEERATESQIARLGDVSFFASMIIGPVFFALLLLTINTMIDSVNERTAEFAILKVVGFSSRLIFALITGESLLLCVTGSFTGLAVAAAIFPSTQSYVGISASLPTGVVAEGIALAIVLAITVATGPALRTARLGVTDALAHR